MTDEAKAIIDQALKLPAEDRELLVELIMESLAPPPTLTEEQIAELERRDRLYREDPSRAIPWEQVKADVLERLAKTRAERETQADAS